MVAKRIIPCLDVADGRVVKGVNFVGLRDAGDPVELACRYSATGADELVFLDIAASHQGRATLVELVRRTAEAVTIPFTVGGGISTVEGITELLRAGADKVSLNSSAVRDPELVARGAERFGCQCIVVAIDARRRQGLEHHHAGALVPEDGGKRAFGILARQRERIGMAHTRVGDADQHLALLGRRHIDLHDLQHDFCAPGGWTETVVKKDISSCKPAAEATQTLVAAARAAAKSRGIDADASPRT